MSEISFGFVYVRCRYATLPYLVHVNTFRCFDFKSCPGRGYARRMVIIIIIIIIIKLRGHCVITWPRFGQRNLSRRPESSRGGPETKWIESWDDALPRCTSSLLDGQTRSRRKRNLSESVGFSMTFRYWKTPSEFRRHRCSL
jgi:hypothetical protein